MDQTSDQASSSQTTEIAVTEPAAGDRRTDLSGKPDTPENQISATSCLQGTAALALELQDASSLPQAPVVMEPSVAQVDDLPNKRHSSVTSLSSLDIARYAAQVGVSYPTTNGSDLYKIASLIPRRLRSAFEHGLGDVVSAYIAELNQHGEPEEQPIPDVLALYMIPGLVSAAVLYESYQRAVSFGHGLAFLSALQRRSSKALDILLKWLDGNRLHQTVSICYPIQHTK